VAREGLRAPPRRRSGHAKRWQCQFDDHPGLRLDLCHEHGCRNQGCD
jgi:hypothetical protein